MDLQEIIKQLSLSDHPVGLGGCKSHKKTLECCEYNLTMFDGKKEKDSIQKFQDKIIRIHHGSIDESDPDTLQKFDGMSVISDADWSLKMFLSKIKEKSDRLRQSSAKSCLVNALYYTTKAGQGLGTDQFAPAWIKCAAFFVTDAIVLMNSDPRSPAHMLEYIRGSKKSKAAKSFSVVADAMGLERATPSLLERMVKSTIGFSEAAGNSDSEIISAKYRYLVEHSLLSDCYFYLGYQNKANVVSVMESINKKPELVHILKVALDFENDPTRLEQQTKSLHKLANDLSGSLQNYG